MTNLPAYNPHPALGGEGPLRTTFPQEGKENRDFPSPLGRGQGEGLEQLQKHVIFAVLLLVSALFPFDLYAGTSFGQAGDYLRYGAGARALAMGGAFTGVADDASAEYWNPAALAFLDEYQLQTMYAPFANDTNLYYTSLGAPLGTRWGALGVSDLLLRSSGFQSRDELNYASGGNGEISSNALSLSYGKSFMDLWSAGARVRFLQQKILSDSGNAFAADLSAYSRP